ncbi:MAG: hypothetical protein IJ882_02160 [Paludibacteraceae bacterium]|nr:hypothetical protein [Paludibacteraceae bacterium]
MKVNVIMPMLGGGTRMQGCQPTCKPLMRLPDGERFFVRALESLSNYQIEDLVLVVLKDYFYEFGDILEHVKEVCGAKRIRIMPHEPTRTPAETFRIGFERLSMTAEKRDLPLFCLDCDIYGLIPQFEDVNLEAGRMFWFPSSNPNKCYIETMSHNDSVVRRVAEKKVISNKAVIGAYLFEDIHFLNRLLLYGEKDLKGRLDYISDIFAYMLKDGEVVGASPADNVTNYGTLEELNSLYDNQ